MDIAIQQLKELPAKLYFIGAGGIGMSALVRYCLAKGAKVAGYDRTASELTDKLIAEGANIHFEDDVNLIPQDFKTSSMVVYTPAIPDEHNELTYFRNNGATMLKRAQLLGLITKTTRSVCIAGTHGKTTTSSMTAHILKRSSIDCNAFLGGILKNYNSNLLLSDKTDLTVIEADEYDRSFHYLNPYIAVVTSADPDHLDVYGTPEVYRKNFEIFTSLIRPDGILLIKKDINIQPKPPKETRRFTYSMTDSTADFYSENIRIVNGEVYFDFVSPAFRIDDVRLGVPVRINIENAVAAMAASTLLGAEQQDVKNAIASFKGVERRFDVQFKTADTVYIDDYAHHPAELTMSIRSVKELYPDRVLTGVFQPHLYTRTRDFADDFAAALSHLDRLILLDIYPAREKPIQGVSSEIIFEKVTITDKRLCAKSELLNILNTLNLEALLTLGAGDIDRFVEPIRKLLETKELSK
jgi:UDP-N-acetylmuramate--alanine ligase